MGFVNKVMLLGNTTRDPELRTLPSGTVVCDFGIAVNRVYKTSGGEEKQETAFIDCSAFGRVAEVIAEYAPKGRCIFVEGRLHFESWDDKNGNRRNKLSVIVENFQFIGSRDVEQREPEQLEFRRAAERRPEMRTAAKSRGTDRFEKGQRPEPAPRSSLRAKTKPQDAQSIDQRAEEQQVMADADLPF
jgi:single-strand DNA-binding protein